MMYKSPSGKIFGPLKVDDKIKTVNIDMKVRSYLLKVFDNLCKKIF